MNWIRKLAGRIRGEAEGDKPPSPEEERSLRTLEKSIGYRFRNLTLLRRAVTHPSIAEEHRGCDDNQRLEFLGDSILGALLAEKLYHLYPDDDEGILTRGRSVLARGEYLAPLAESLGIHKAMRMSRSELRTKGNLRPSTLEDAIEAVVGAVYLDGGMTVTRKTVLAWYGDLEIALADAIEDYNPKGRLQELGQALYGQEPVRYSVDKESGPPHDKHFVISVHVGGTKRGTGRGKSKKEAEEKAARKALRALSRMRPKEKGKPKRKGKSTSKGQRKSGEDGKKPRARGRSRKT